MSVQLFDNIDINGMFKWRLCIYNVCMVNVCSQMKCSNTDYIYSLSWSTKGVFTHKWEMTHEHIYSYNIEI